MLEEVAKISQRGADKIKVRSALNPILWLCGIMTPTCFVATYVFFRAGMPLAFCWTSLITGIVPIIVVCGVYIGFALFSPESLQSEAYQLQRQALKLIESHGTPLKVAPVSIEAITTLTAGQSSRN